MNTVAHMLIASAALAKVDAPKRNRAVMAGALLPDLSMFVFFGWSRIQGWSGDETWNVQYWTEPWQTFSTLSNSAVLFSLLLGTAIWRNRPVLIVLAAAALLHILCDLPLHADDAHRHFWPLTDFRFHSPISYWDPAANGMIGSAIEAVFCLGALALLWLRFSAPKWRLLFAALAALQIVLLAAQFMWINQT